MNDKFNKLRKEYPEFIYENYDLEIVDNNLKITFNFNIPNLTTFHPTTTIPLNNEKIDLNDSFLRNLIFHLGLIELVSYNKATCSPNIIIRAGYIDEEQINWLKKLYYNGLGEFMYLNKINIDEDKLFNITCSAPQIEINIPDVNTNGNLIPIGGGKDSCVSLELLKNYKEDNLCFIINPKDITLECAKIAGYNEKQIIGITRTIHQNLLDLNKKGFLNGHTPFSSIVAFNSYIVAYIYKKKYITLSNENSANEPTVIGTKINHQYSKSYEFENDFNNYTKKYFKIDITYFSLLRPLSEFQIGMLFSSYQKYHQTFKSCNVGSKTKPWHWCCNCPKCLFVFIILSPFLYKEKLIEIFGEDLFTKEELLKTFLELLGYRETKPFECVGSYGEVRYAISLTIKNYQGKLPFLLKYYQEKYPLALERNYKNEFNEEHNLPDEYEKILRKELTKYDK